MKTGKHCNFCGKYGHDESKCFEKMEYFEVAMKKQNISIDFSCSSSSHGHALSSYGFSLNETSNSSSSNE